MSSYTFLKVSVEGFVLTGGTLTMKSWKTCTEHLRNKGHPETKTSRNNENGTNSPFEEVFENP
jgi:hypothetical protein